MQAQLYLQNKLQNSAKYTLSGEEKEFISKNGMEAYIFWKLTSKKFRKYKLDEACIERTKRAIHLQVKRKEPLTIVYPQGGYKLWRLPSSPTVDWAEFFTIAYLISYVAPIASAYKPGVHITYYMHTLLMELHDNLTQEEIQEYVSSFQALLNQFKPFLPKNIMISILRDADIYTRNEYFAALEAGKITATKQYATWTDQQKTHFNNMAKLNIKWKGKENWTELSNGEKERKIYQSALYEIAAITQLKKVSEIIKGPDNILIFTKQSKEFIGIGTTKSSIAKYWVGMGVLEQTKDGFKDRILTPKQLETFTKLTSEDISLIPLPNFKSIDIYPEMQITSLST